MTAKYEATCSDCGQVRTLAYPPTRARCHGCGIKASKPSRRERLLALTAVSEGACWLWRGHLTRGGYGQFESRVAHRAAYELFVGPIPDGLQLDHLCRVRNCVNPTHLEPVTAQENTLRSRRIKTACKNGHEFSEENTRLVARPDRPGPKRQCVTCELERRSRKAGASQ